MLLVGAAPKHNSNTQRVGLDVDCPDGAVQALRYATAWVDKSEAAIAF